jgi:hypothetical protein
MSDLIPLEDLAQEANDSHEQVIKNTKQAISAAWSAGQALLRAKSQTPHGEWLAWQKLNLNYSQQTASRYMTIASNYSSMSNLKDAKDINDALRMISERKAEENPEHVPRAERKTGRVKVEQAANQSTDVTEKGDTRPVDDDPNPAPKTNTKHSPANAKAKEADRPVPAAVAPEFVSEPGYDRRAWDDPVPEKTLADWSVAEMLAFLKDSADEPKKRAKELRKAADELDPPAVGAPSIEAVEAWATENRLPDFDANKFFNHYELAGWKYGKAKTPIKDWKRAAANAYAGGKGWAVDGANRLPF